MDTVVLNEAESRRYLSGNGIPMNRFLFVAKREQLYQAAQTLRFPLVMKLVSPKAVHKSDVGGVVLHITGTEELLEGWDRIFRQAGEHGIRSEDVEGVTVQEELTGTEILVGLKRDATFGPVLVVGSGGVLVELVRDAVVGICPLTEKDVDDMLSGIRSYRLLEGYRGMPAGDIPALRRMLMEVSRMAMSRDDWEEIDLNPDIVGKSGEGAFAVDARVVCRAPAVSAAGE